MIYSNSDFDRLLNSFFLRPGYTSSTSAINHQENDPYEINYTKDGAYCFFEVPGFNKNNLKVELEDGVVEVNGKRTYKVNGEEKQKTISHRFRIGEGYESSSLEATVEDGILTLFVHNYKKPEKKKRITIL